jgi:spore photoproduct lyase
MAGSRYIPQKVYVEAGSRDFPLAKRVLKNLGQVPVEIITRPQELIENIKTQRDAVGEGKKNILITRQKGDFVKPCPCTPHYIGCNYYIINLDLNCPLDCSYCILQSYLTSPLITIHVNIEDLWKELDIFLHKKRRCAPRIGTGELADSLALDHITENSRDLISYFGRKKNVYFELKTKTTNIENILKTNPARNIVISWSLNSYQIAKQEEKGAPPVDERINAAKRVLDRGFWLGFHFDPIIRYPGWAEDYREVIQRLLNTVDPARIAWISLGSLRFPPSLKPIIKKRFPRTKIIYDEFIHGIDGKIRYFKPLRLELYRKIASFIKKTRGSDVPIYLCMESGEIWEKVLGWKPRGKEEVECFLSFPLDSP